MLEFESGRPLPQYAHCGLFCKKRSAIVNSGTDKCMKGGIEGGCVKTALRVAMFFVKLPEKISRKCA